MNVMFESHVVLFEDFLSNLILKINIYCVTDNPSIIQSWRSVLKFKFSVLIFCLKLSNLLLKITWVADCIYLFQKRWPTLMVRGRFDETAWYFSSLSFAVPIVLLKYSSIPTYKVAKLRAKYCVRRQR